MMLCAWQPVPTHLVQHAIPAVQATQVEVLQLLQLLLCTGSHPLCLLSVCGSITESTADQHPREWASQETQHKECRLQLACDQVTQSCELTEQ